jgi:hypothetical protein
MIGYKYARNMQRLIGVINWGKIVHQVRFYYTEEIKCKSSNNNNNNKTVKKGIVKTGQLLLNMPIELFHSIQSTGM